MVCGKKTAGKAKHSSFRMTKCRNMLVRVSQPMLLVLGAAIDTLSFYSFCCVDH